jgi:hypothetical protein
MRDIFNEMRGKTTELLTPHQNGHPITYNQLFVETLESLRRERRQKEPERILCQFFGVNKLEAFKLAGTYDLQELANLLAASSEPDVKRSAASDALDCLNAYYKVG